MISLATIDDVEPQVLFDHIINSLRKQGCKSVKINTQGYTQCVYRGPNGTKCAAGYVITDDEYSPDIECRRILWLKVVDGKATFTKDVIESMNRSLVQRLQNVHDNYQIDEWEDKFKQIAKEFSLEYVPKN